MSANDSKKLGNAGSAGVSAAQGKLGIMIPGMGAVATTFVAGVEAVQEWLSFYFKSPMHAPGLYPEHDLFIQSMKLKNTLRHLMGEEMITHLGLEYYDAVDSQEHEHARM
ncbi:MAG TPA: inositol-3-phosphate synthase [Dongiaceae bacterium]|nr:inositol-3-phosphate synthase [Dongiaceae bacterium]